MYQLYLISVIETVGKKLQGFAAAFYFFPWSMCQIIQALLAKYMENDLFFLQHGLFWLLAVAVIFVIWLVYLRTYISI